MQSRSNDLIHEPYQQQLRPMLIYLWDKVRDWASRESGEVLP